MNFKAFNESLSSNIKHKIVQDNSTYFEATANIGDREIVFSAGRQEPGIWEIEFSQKGKGYIKTGDGDEFKVFSFVLQMIEELICKHSPERVEFTAEKLDNRTSLYKRLANKMFKEYNYEISSIKSAGKQDLFTIEKKEWR